MSPPPAAEERLAGYSEVRPRSAELGADSRRLPEAGGPNGYSPLTPRNHVCPMFVALDAHSRVEAVAKAHRLRLLASNDGRR